MEGKARVAICSCGVFNFSHPAQDYLAPSNAIKHLYASRHENVDYFFYDRNPHKDRDPHFARFSICLELLRKDYDWVLWMDCDAVPVNFGVDISEVLSGHERKVLAEDDILGLNSGVLAIPNTTQARKWLREMDSAETYEKYVKSNFQDQDAIADSFKTDEWCGLRGYPSRNLGLNHFENLYKWYRDTGLECPNPYRKGDFILHLAGYADTYRRVRFNAILNDVEYGRCPVCGSPMVFYFDAPEMFNHSEFMSYDKCAECGFIRNRFFDTFSKKYMVENIYSRHKEYDSETENDCDALFGSIKFPVVLRGDRVLDYGRFYDGLAERVEHELGVWADACDCIYGYEQLPPSSEKYTFVIASRIIDKIRNPNVFFMDVSERLCDHGQLLVETPVYDRIRECSVTTPDRWTFVRPCAGVVSLYSRKSIEILAARHGFVILEKGTSDRMVLMEKRM